MSYSRWSKDSVWYCYWSAWGPENQYKWPTKKLKYSQCFEVCDFPSYFVTYGQLKTIGLKQVVKEMQDFYKDKKEGIQLSDYTKMRRYLIEFMTDVDEHFKWDRFFLYEWYYPIRNKLWWKCRKIFKK